MEQSQEDGEEEPAEETSVKLITAREKSMMNTGKATFQRRQDAVGPSQLIHTGGVRMVDITGKAPSSRVATAAGRIYLRPETLRLILKGEIPKGNVLAVAQIAAVMGAKRAPDLIPLCHPLPVSAVEVQFKDDSHPGRDGLCRIDITATVKTVAATGVEMEALTAVCCAALTVYDMCKSRDRDMHFGDVMLLSKSGGRSGEYRRKKSAAGRSNTARARARIR